jgi:HTH-type transcriptional repressor of NAD biosynthesis genes
MKYYTQGIVVGKFWPPHNGHLHLIRNAANHCSILDVWLIESFNENPRGAQRLAWLKEELADYTNIYFKVVPNLPPGHDDNSEAWADYTKKMNGGWIPGVVFTSEEYGETWAKALGCDHVQVDLERGTHPVSGTKVRTCPMSVWSHIPKSVRPSYVKKVLILGAESTGKTTLAQRLAEHFDSAWVPEYGRTYCEKYGTNHHDPTIWPMILQHQPDLEDTTAKYSKNGMIICDTDLLTTAVWYNAWRGIDNMYLQIVEAGRARKYDVVLFLDHNDVPWVDDGTRTTEDRDRRAWFSRHLESAAKTHSPIYTKITGDWDNRFNVAVEVIDTFLKEENDRATRAFATGNV